MFRIVIVLTFLAAFACPALAAWEEPKDGKLTEKEVTGYIGLSKDILALAQEQGQKVKDAKTEVAAFSASLAISGKFDALLKKYDMTDGEWSWVTSRVWEATGAIYQEEMMAKTIRGQFDTLARESAAKVTALKDRIAVHEKALKEGKRVLANEQREEIVNSAKDNQKSALEEAKNHTDAAKAALEEAATKDKEAVEAEKLAKHPPADVEKDNLADYIKEKREESKTAREAAVEARKNAVEEQKQEKECRAKAAMLAKQAENPDVPATAEEKEQVAKENKEAIDNARQELAAIAQTQVELIKVSADLEKNNKENMAKVHPDNLALVRKRLKEIKGVWGINDEADNKK